MFRSLFWRHILLSVSLIFLTILLPVTALAHQATSFSGTHLAQTSTQNDWPMYGFDLQHTHFNPNEQMLSSSNVSSLALDWTLSLTPTYRISTSVSVVNGVAYEGSADGKLYAVNAATGATIWTAPSVYGSSTITATPAVVNGVVYVASEFSILSAYDAATGTKLWSYYGALQDPSL